MSAIKRQATEIESVMSNTLPGRRSWLRSAVLRPGVVLLLSLIGAATGFAAGTQGVHVGEDLTIRLDSRWEGGHEGGYYPIRTEVRNAGPTRTLEFMFRPTHGTGPTVRRIVTVEQGDPIKFSLLIPMLGSMSQGKLNVRVQGQRRSIIDTVIPLPDRATNTGLQQSLLVISANAVNCDNFDQACNRRSSYSGFRNSSSQTIEPVSLPESWLDYSGLDLVAIGLKTLQTLSAAERTALLAWVHTGGTLLVYNTGSGDSAAAQLDQALQLEQHAMKSPDWTRLPIQTNANRTNANPSQIGTPTQFADVIPTVDPTQAANATQIFPGTAPQTVAAQQQVPQSTIEYRQLMNGHVYAWQGNPFPGNLFDWFRILDDLGQKRWSWTGRHGNSPRNAHSEFLSFLIPGISSVPVYVYLGFITAFTILIGPVNYAWFRRRRQLHYLLFSIPALAGISCLTLLSYSVLSHGFGIQSRVRSVTVLDQRSNTAVSDARVTLHAGVAPFQGLQFDRNIAVYPVWANGREFESGELDWTTNQACQSGWMRSRTQTQFLTVGHHRQRGHLDFEQDTDGTLTVANGLAWKIEGLAVMAPDGRLHVGGPLEAGATMRLQPAVAKSPEIENLVGLLNRYPAKFPPRSYRYANSPRRSNNYWTVEQNQQAVTANMGDRLGERRLIKAVAGLSENRLPWPRSYVAICNQNPEIDTGVENAREVDSNHIIVGYY